VTERLPMTRGRVLALVIGVPLVLAVIGWTALTGVAFAGQGSYPVNLDVRATGGTAGVSVDSANMTVVRGAAGRLRLTGTAHYSVVRSSVTSHRTRSGVTVASRCRFPTGVCSADFTVAIPASARAVLSDGSGDMTLRGLTGYVKAGAGSGNISAYGLSGTADLGSGSGDVRGTALSGPHVMLSSGSGNINVSGLITAHVVASDSSGDVTLVFTKVPSFVHVTDDSGNVTLVLPPGRATQYQVNASTGSGNSVIGVPTTPESRNHVIIVTDGSGDISITN
jgi:hypothetical protein